MMNVTMRPGKVIEVLEHGNIKVEAPGLFDRSDKDNLPIVMPWYSAGTNSYNTPTLHDWVWVLNVSDNPLQLFWFRKDDHVANNGDLEMKKDIEILCNKSVAKGQAQLYYADDEGWVMKVGNKGFNIDNTGNVKIETQSGGKLSVEGKTVNCGSATEPGVLGNSLSDVLSNISATLKAIRSAASGNYITAPIAIAIGQQPETLDDLIPNTLSQDVKLS